MNTALIIATIALVLLGALALGFVALVWYIFRRPLPQVNGEIEIPDLAQAITIVRDRWGVPHIYAETERDAFFAQGYVHAQDRLFQMEYSRRLARGTLAEAFGAAALEADRWSRVIGFWRAAQGDAQQLGAAEIAALDAYAAGVNAFIASHRLRMPAEFTIAGFKPAPWQAQDTLGLFKVLGWALSQNWEGELLRVQLMQTLGPERAAELEPFYPAGNPIAVPNLGGLPVGQPVAWTGRTRRQ
jgi:penicillin amidase